MYTKTITPTYEMKGKRKKLTGYIGELCDETTCVHFKEYSTYSQAESALDALAFELLTDLSERGLIDELPTFDPTTCVFCHKPHNPAHCPEKNALLFAPDAPVVCSEPDNLCDVHNPCAAHAADAARYLASEASRPARCATCGGEGYCPDCGTLFMSDPVIQQLDLIYPPLDAPRCVTCGDDGDCPDCALIYPPLDDTGRCPDCGEIYCECDDDYADAMAEQAMGTYNGKVPADFIPVDVDFVTVGWEA